jgi:hypothetical protein
VAVVAEGGVDADLEAGEDAALVVTERAAEFEGVFVEATLAGLDISGPELGFGAAEAAEGPFGVDEGIDETGLLGGIGVEAGGVGGDEGIEIGSGFVGDDFGFGIDTGFEGVEIEGGSGFSGDGAGAGGFLGVTAIGFDLEWRRHKVLRPGG